MPVSRSFHPRLLHRRLAAHGGRPEWLVAYSGGLDSTVLLHVLAGLRSRPPLRALHVHHGLLPEAEAWTRHCRAQARELGVVLEVLRVDAAPPPGASPEAAARRARYAALRAHMRPGSALFVAHHADDQAETVLLQLLRGAGPRGLSGMPAEVPFGVGCLVRPLLEWPRAALAAYAEAEGLSWVEDPSNRDPRVDRSFLRMEILPRMRARWPSLARTLGRAAVLQAEAAEILERDARVCLSEVAGPRPGTLSASRLLALPRAHGANLVQQWIRSRGLPVPGRARLERILDDVAAARADAQPCVRWPGGEVRRYRDALYALRPLSELTERLWRWDQRAPLPLPALGITLSREALLTAGFELPPPEIPLEVRLRRGGERCALGGSPRRRPLGKYFQEAGIPPWERDRMPLIYAGDRLLGVVGLGPCRGEG